MSLIPINNSPDKLLVERTTDGKYIRVTLDGYPRVSVVLTLGEWSAAIAKPKEFSTIDFTKPERT